MATMRSAVLDDGRASNILGQLLISCNEQQTSSDVAFVIVASVSDKFLLCGGPWLQNIQHFSDAPTRSTSTEAAVRSFRESLSSSLLLFEICRRCTPKEMGDERCEWLALKNRIGSLLFSDTLPVLVKSFATPHDPLWDEVNAAVMHFCATVSRTDIRTSERCMVLENFVASVLISASCGEVVSPIFCNVVLLLGTAMDAFRHAFASDNERLLTAVHMIFLQCCNTLSDTLLYQLLLSLIPSGIIRAGCMYTTDLDVLLCILRRKQASNVDLSPAASRCELKLLRDMAPTVTSSVADVVEWFHKLNLSGEYTAVLKRQGVDGAVLWSDLELEDILEMGIHQREDAQKVASLLSMR